MDSVVSPIEGKKPQVLVPESRQTLGNSTSMQSCSPQCITAKGAECYSYSGTWGQKAQVST